jgi:hypothetical protein
VTDNRFGDERIQFFLRNRADIKAWAAIEPDVMAATRELLARAQPEIEEALLALDHDVLVGRHDGGPWERIFARRERWPESLGLALEWHRNVDPTSNPPKMGVFWCADRPTSEEQRTRFATVVDRPALQKLGYKVPMSAVWPVGAFVPAAPDWWQDPPSWITATVERLSAAWPLIAPLVDEVLRDNGQVSGG